MERQLGELRAQLEELAREMGELRRRVEGLERQGRASAANPAHARGEQWDVPEAHEAAAPGLIGSLLPARTIALIGRTLVVLGGGYLFRAVTETGVIPALGGALAGLAYAAWWLVQADRTASRGDRLGAAFHGFAAVLIGYPLIWETTARFGLLGPHAAATALVAFSGLGLAVAGRRGIQAVAWTITLFALVTALGLIVGTHSYLPYTVALVLMAAAVEGSAFRDHWLPLRWHVALGLDLAVLMMTSGALGGETPLEGYTNPGRLALIAAALALPALYLGSIGARTLLRERPTTLFEVVQAPLALFIGLTGAARVIAAAGGDPASLGVMVFLLGGACYAAAFTSIDRRLGRCRNFYVYTTLAGLLVLIGSYGVLGGAVLAIVWSALALAAVLIGARFDRITLKFHGGVYVAAAATVAGLMACAFDGLIADPADAWRPVRPLCIGVALVAAACYGILVATPARNAFQWFEILPQALVGAVVVWSVAGLVSPWVAGGMLAASSGTGEAAFLAAGRTAVIALLAVALAWAGRRWDLEELVWLVYPVLVGGGVKLLFEDFRYGQPVTLFIALAFYGTSLILTPRLIRRET